MIQAESTILTTLIAGALLSLLLLPVMEQSGGPADQGVACQCMGAANARLTDLQNSLQPAEFACHHDSAAETGSITER